jgi:hypothetical protein
LITRLLLKDASTRLGAGPEDGKEIQAHPFFEDVNWQLVFERMVKIAWKPGIASETDTSHFSEEFTIEDPIVSYEPPPVIDSDENPFADFTSQQASVIGDDS